MGIIIKDLKIDEENYSFISNDNKNVLEGLSKINIFVGQNNSGKSRLLRSILSNELNFFSYNEDANFIINSPYNLSKELRYYSKDNGHAFVIFNKIMNFSRILTRFHKNKFFLKPNLDIAFNSQELKIISSITKKNFFKNELNVNFEFEKIYIPILRGLRPLNYGPDRNSLMGFDENVYKMRTINDFPNLEKNCCVFTGLEIYNYFNEYTQHLDDSKQDIISDYEEFLSDIFNQNIKITPIKSENSSNSQGLIKVRIGDEKGRMIYDLGDGLQSMIIMTFPLFLYKDKVVENKNILFFIEEPEHMLHPSLQRKLIEAFHDERFKNFQFFFTTHSNHFLDVSLDYDDVSIYNLAKFQYKNNFKFTIKKVGFGDNDILNLLGVRNSSVFLPNCNIWVEGVTDAFYLRKFLEIYQKHMKIKDTDFVKFDEDRHFSFFVYNGDNITTLLNLELDDNDKKLNRILIIRDGDTNYVEYKKDLNERIKKKFGNNFVLLNCRTIENLLSKKVILKTLHTYSEPKNISLNENFDYNDYKDEDLGLFIKKQIFNDQINLNPIKKKKKKFFERAEKNINGWSDISEESKKLTEHIYKFIESNN